MFWLLRYLSGNNTYCFHSHFTDQSKSHKVQSTRSLKNIYVLGCLLLILKAGVRPICYGLFACPLQSRHTLESSLLSSHSLFLEETSIPSPIFTPLTLVLPSGSCFLHCPWDELPGIWFLFLPLILVSAFWLQATLTWERGALTTYYAWNPPKPD